MLKSYLKKVFEIANQGDAREESYYPTLDGLLKEFARSSNKKNIPGYNGFRGGIPILIVSIGYSMTHVIYGEAHTRIICH